MSSLSLFEMAGEQDADMSESLHCTVVVCGGL